MFNKVLILSVDIGGGHTRAAGALQTAFDRLDAARDVHVVDTLEYINKLFRKLFLKIYFDVVRSAPELYGWFYERLNKPSQNQRMHSVFNKLNTRSILKLLDKVQPELVISTHPLPAGILSWLTETGRLGTRQAVVTTDFDVHSMWLVDHYEHYFVALDETKLYLEAVGIPASRVTATGIPIDPAFAENQDRGQARQELDLDPDLTTILVTGGSLGLGPIERLVQSLRHLAIPIQVVVICGYNEPLKASLEKVLCDCPPANHVKTICVGWTDRMHTYMSAADLVAGKTGGLTTSEALAKGLPFLVVNPIQGQEQRNADHLLEECAAIRCNSFPVLAHKVEQLLSDKERLARMRANARRLARPHAAFDVVRKLLEIQAGRSSPVPRAARSVPDAIYSLPQHK
jgi:processive 1,2-diacylglycerol beta-glucosyltransferase